MTEEFPKNKMDYRRRQSLTINALYGDIAAFNASAAVDAGQRRRVSVSGVSGFDDSRRGSVMSGGGSAGM